VSKNINVNPDHYKSAGRERQGEDILHERNKREMALEEKMRTRQRARARAAERRVPRKP
jgi:hypothetical protein